MARTEHAAAAHFVLPPLAAQGHLIPMVGLARLLAAQVSLATTPLNVAELRLDLVELPMSPEKFGLPPDCPNADMLARNDQFIPFFDAMRELASPFESYVRALAPPPSCIVADWCNPWTAGVAASLGIPRLFFHGPQCFFSRCELMAAQHGLFERIAAGKPFLWAVKETEVTTPAALEARTAGRGLVVRGWAPQLAVLSHRATGGFLTHCGWNSLLEAVAHGVPVATWPHFGEQFFNERLVVDVLDVGVPVGAAAPVMILNRGGGVRVARGDVVRAVSALMDGGEVGEEGRKAREYGEKARRAMQKGGSSYESLTRMIENLKL